MNQQMNTQHTSSLVSKKAWWKEAVVYQIYPRSFQDSNGDGIGDLNGITSRMEYLKELGIDVIWLSPIYQSPNDDNGYDISNYQAIMDEFGTMEDFDHMLAQAHKCGIKLMMDLVVNHTSDEHAWFIESRKSKDNPYRDYYIWREAQKDGTLPNNWGSCFAGPAWQYDKQTDMYFLHLFSKKQPDLNWDNPQVRREVYDMMNWWVDKGIDGFRMDVISLISKKEGLPDGKAGINGYAPFWETANGPHVHEYLQEMRREVLNRKDMITVGECSGVTIKEAQKYASLDEKELNMVFQFDHVSLDEENGTKWCDNKVYLPDLKKVMNSWEKGLENIAWNSLFWENHDQPRSVSRFGNDSEQYRELSAKMLATCLHMMQGTPYIYQGEELGMTNAPFKTIEDFRDLDSINAYHELTQQGIFSKEKMMRFLRYKSRDNARTPMQWDTSENAGFTTGTPWIMVNPNYTEINAAEQIQRKNSVFHYYKKLIQLRHEQRVIVYGSYEPYLEENESVFAYIRTLRENTDTTELLVLCNFTSSSCQITIPKRFDSADCILCNYETDKTNQDAFSTDSTLRPYEAKILLLKN